MKPKVGLLKIKTDKTLAKLTEKKMMQMTKIRNKRCYYDHPYQNKRIMSKYYEQLYACTLDNKMNKFLERQNCQN